MHFTFGCRTPDVRRRVHWTGTQRGASVSEVLLGWMGDGASVDASVASNRGGLLPILLAVGAKLSQPSLSLRLHLQGMLWRCFRK